MNKIVEYMIVAAVVIVMACVFVIPLFIDATVNSPTNFCIKNGYERAIYSDRDSMRCYYCINETVNSYIIGGEFCNFLGDGYRFLKKENGG